MNFILLVANKHSPIAGQYLKGPRTPAQVKRYGYGFTNNKALAWNFPSQKQAESKARIVARHWQWGKGELMTRPATPLALPVDSPQTDAPPATN
jgi:hypothetical protein